MKKAAFFAIGILCGILLTLGYQHFSTQDSDRFVQMSDFSLEHALNRVGAEVFYNLPLRMIGSTGEVFIVSFSPQNDGSVKYEWRTEGNDSKSGSGHLFERYRIVGKSERGTDIADDGGQLSLEIADLSLQWSKGGSDSGYIYYHPKHVTLEPQKRGEQDAGDQAPAAVE